jgi:hypothetical protein
MRRYIYCDTAEHPTDQYARILAAFMVQNGWAHFDAQDAILGFDECTSGGGQVLH